MGPAPGTTLLEIYKKCDTRGWKMTWWLGTHCAPAGTNVWFQYPYQVVQNHGEL